MNHLDSSVLVGRLVAECPSRARVLEWLGIDFCCGGQIPLAQACAAKGLDVDMVLRAIDIPDLADGTADWLPESPAQLADVIVSTHHAYLRRELPRLAGLVARVAAVHGANHSELHVLEGLFTDFRSSLDTHMDKEESFVFPLISRLETAASSGDCPWSLTDLISAAEHDHDSAGAALARMRAVTSDYSPPADACASYRLLLAGLAELERDMHSHVHKENNILFPAALAAEAARRAGPSDHGRRAGEHTRPDPFRNVSGACVAPDYFTGRS
jgi:regulator of cell morphogenesis and NO signaling